MKPTDISYRKQGLFTLISPESKAGEHAWSQLKDAGQLIGSSILTMHFESFRTQLKDKGYTIRVNRKSLKMSEIEEDELLNQLQGA